jgi:hypothetical protein
MLEESRQMKERLEAIKIRGYSKTEKPIEQENHLKVILINHPDVEDECKKVLKRHRFKNVQYFEDANPNDPVGLYKFQQISKIDMIKDALKTTVEEQKKIKNLGAINVKTLFDILIEKHSTSQRDGLLGIQMKMKVTGLNM